MLSLNVAGPGPACKGLVRRRGVISGDKPVEASSSSKISKLMVDAVWLRDGISRLLSLTAIAARWDAARVLTLLRGRAALDLVLVGFVSPLV